MRNITRPIDLTLNNRLAVKLVEYKRRPESVSTSLKIEVLEAVLMFGLAEYDELYRIFNRFDDLDVCAFNKAWAIIEDYCTTGGTRVQDGTGLRNASDQEQTLIINRTSSRCGNCGSNASPEENRHVMRTMQGDGCGVNYRFVSSDYEQTKEACIALRPDLPWRENEFVM